MSTGPIEQKLGFDVSDALNALKQLDSTLAGLESRLQSFASRLGGFNQTGSAADSVAQKLGNTLKSDVVSALLLPSNRPNGLPRRSAYCLALRSLKPSCAACRSCAMSSRRR